MGAEEKFAGNLPGRFVRTISLTIGGVPKNELYEKANAARTVSPYAKRIMKHEQFTTLAHPETALVIALTPEDLGFTERPTIAEVLDNGRLAKWSAANLPGWEVTLNPAEIGPQLAIQYTGQMEGEFLWVGMERIPGSGGRPYIFYLERNDEGGRSLDAHWTYPYALWRLDYLVALRLRKKS
ncbi:MAG: hypothetical protein ACREO5_05080 [Candidatus Binatia bacterium]